MSKMTWFRLYHDIIFEIKMRRFSPQEKWAWIVLLCLASQSEERGSVLVDDEDIADLCEFNTLQDWLYFKDKLRSKEMIEMTPAGLKISHWGDRQFQSDLSTDRVRKHREMQAQSRLQELETENETGGNDMKRFRNVAETPPDTDTYRDQELLEITEDHECIVDSQIESTAITPIAFSEEDQPQGIHGEIDSGGISAAPEEQPPVSDGVTELDAKKDAAAQKTQSEKKAEAEAEFKELYNQKKPPNWPSLLVLNEKRRKALRQVCKDMGGYKQGIEAIANALTYACSDEWFSKHRLTFENLFSNGKVIQLHEKFLEAQRKDAGGETRSPDLPKPEIWLALMKKAFGRDVVFTLDDSGDIGNAIVQVGRRSMTYRIAATSVYPISSLKRDVTTQKVAVGV